MELESTLKIKNFARENIDDLQVADSLAKLFAVTYPKNDGEDFKSILDVDDLRLDSYVVALTVDGNFDDTIITAVDRADHVTFASDLVNRLLPAFVACNKLYYGIVQPGYASGDQFGIGFTLVNDPHSEVYLTTAPGESTGESSAKYYKALGVADHRIHMNVDRKQATAAIKAVTGENKRTPKSESGVRGVNEGTYQVAKTFSPAKREKYREAMSLQGDGSAAHDRDPQVKEWLQSKGVPESGKVAILWSRFSGKSGNAHTEHDTSYNGMAQIIAGCKDMDAVLIVGDSQPKGKTGGREKYEKIAETFNNYGGSDPESPWGGNGKWVGRGRRRKWVEIPGDGKDDTFGAKVIVMTEFWNEDGVKSWGGNDRRGQFLLFDYLHRKYDVARHLGFRSGNLEAIAMLGFDVRYMEEPDSWGGDRMAVWHGDADGKTPSGGDAPGYERLGVSGSSNRLGQHLLEQTDPKYRSEQLAAYPTPAERKKARWNNPEAPEDERISRPRGFADDDLPNIDQYLVNGDPLHGVPDVQKTAVKNLADRVNSAKKKHRAADLKQQAHMKTGKGSNPAFKKAMDEAKLAIKTAKDEWDTILSSAASDQEKKLYERAATHFLLKFPTP
ncbi:hypothetical protein ACTVZO_39495 [Streptomyces sp. IBSNAI002]|uniref:hypothetical protein n=1 Tax=Streptomyces sp. IBSNAI002 TaxID=3457500 RepID=UPI003FD6750D